MHDELFIIFMLNYFWGGSVLMSATYFKMHKKLRWIEGQRDGCTGGYVIKQI